MECMAAMAAGAAADCAGVSDAQWPAGQDRVLWSSSKKCMLLHTEVPESPKLELQEESHQL